MADTISSASHEDYNVHAPSVNASVSSPPEDLVGMKSLETMEAPAPRTSENLSAPVEPGVGDSESTMQIFEVQESPNSVPTIPRRLQVLRQASYYLSLYIAGYNAGVNGTLLPTIEKQYDLKYSTVSLIFVSYCIGYLIAATGSGKAIKSWGIGKVFLGSGVVMMAGIIINCAQLVSFPLMCAAYVIVGTGFSTQLGIANSYFCILSHPLLRMGVLHGTFGFGAFTSPLVATALISHNFKLNYFYFTSLGLIVPANVLIYFAFVHGNARYDSLPEEPVVISAGPTPKGSLKEVLTRADVWILAIFLLFYAGSCRRVHWRLDSLVSRGYAAWKRLGSGLGSLWILFSCCAGLAVGRLCLPIVNHLLGERRIVLVYILLAGALQAVSWAAKSFVATAVATALVGFVISTFYTAAIHTASMLLPRRMHTNAMTVITSVGQGGSALFPFVIGIISNKKGIWVMQPAVVALLGGQFVLWMLVPKTVRRHE